MINFPLFVTNNDNSENEIPDCKIVSSDDFPGSYSDFFHESFSLLHLNIRSCRQNFEQFHLFLISLTCKFSIIALTETWLTNELDF